MEDRREIDTSWKVDKHIPLALMLTIVLQTVSIVWFAAKMDSRIEVNQKAVMVNQQSIINHDERLKYIETTRIEDKDLVMHRALISADTKALLAPLLFKLEALADKK